MGEAFDGFPAWGRSGSRLRALFCFPNSKFGREKPRSPPRRTPHAGEGKPCQPPLLLHAHPRVQLPCARDGLDTCTAAVASFTAACKGALPGACSVGLALSGNICLTSWRRMGHGRPACLRRVRMGRDGGARCAARDAAPARAAVAFAAASGLVLQEHAIATFAIHSAQGKDTQQDGLGARVWGVTAASHRCFRQRPQGRPAAHWATATAGTAAAVPSVALCSRPGPPLARCEQVWALPDR